jgi:hypothetical protein
MMEQANLNYINELCGDDFDFKIKIISILKKELPEEIIVYNGCKKNINFRLMADSVHKLKHKISLLGLEKSYYIAGKFEENLKNNSTNLQSDFEGILKKMQEFVILL